MAKISVHKLFVISIVPIQNAPNITLCRGIGAIAELTYLVNSLIKKIMRTFMAMFPIRNAMKRPTSANTYTFET